jgi:hypothetical protein
MGLRISSIKARSVSDGTPALKRPLFRELGVPSPASHSPDGFPRQMQSIGHPVILPVGAQKDPWN